MRSAYTARRLLEISRQANTVLEGSLLSNPGWDILLDLFIQRSEGKRISIISVCVAANAPTSTVLRYIQAMMDSGTIVKRPSPSDTAVSLTGEPIMASTNAFAFRHFFSESCQGQLHRGLDNLGEAFLARIAEAQSNAPPRDRAKTPAPNLLPAPVARQYAHLGLMRSTGARTGRALRSESDYRRTSVAGGFSTPVICPMTSARRP